MLVRAVAPFRRGKLDSARKVRKGRCASLLLVFHAVGVGGLSLKFDPGGTRHSEPL